MMFLSGDGVGFERGCHTYLHVVIFAALAALLLVRPANSAPLNLSVNSETISRYYERDDKAGKVHYVVPAYEFLRLDYGNFRTPGLSLHAYGWGRLNLRDSYFNKDTAGELLYGYLDYVPTGRDYQLRFGRQYVFEGVTRDSIDGIYAKTDVIPTVTLSGYAGYPVTLDSTNGRRGDYAVGGKISHGRPGVYDAGFSYKLFANDGKRDEELLGTDLFLSLPLNVSLLGHTSYNAVTGGFAEHSYEARIPVSQFELRPYFQRFNYNDFFNQRANSAHPFRFLAQLGTTVTSYGTEAFWYPTEQFELGARVKNYEYDSRFNTAQYYTLMATLRRKIFSEVGAEIGRMVGTGKENRYYLSRAYFFWDLPPGFVTGDVLYVSYDEEIYRKDSAFFASVGVGRKFLNKALNVKLSLDYSQDPYFAKDYRGTLAVNYTY